MNTLNRKSWGDLARHRTRTLLAAGTLAIAIASLGFLAVPGLLNAAMNRQVQQGRLNEVAISTRVTGLTPAQLGALGRLPGVAAVSADLSYVTTTTTTAGGTQNIVIDGGGLASATVNTLLLMSGRLPGPGEALADVADGKAAGYTVPAGGTLGVRAASGATVRLRVSGTGLNLAYTPGANSTGVPVFYTSIATAQALSGTRGYNHLGFRLTDDSPAAQDRVIAEVRAYLTAQTGSDPITSLPYTRAPGYWPGQTGFNDLMAVLYIITVLAFGSALFLIAATMNTLIAEQAREIAILKALGGRRRQIGGITARTAAMLGLAGAIAGAILGVAVAYLLARYFAERIVDVSLGFGVSVPVIVGSLVAGPVLAVAASLPALRRALRRPVAETLTGADTDGGYGAGWLDRIAARGRLAERVPGSLRLGFRDVLRQRRRSVAVIAQVAVAAGLAMSFLALGQSIDSAIAQAVGKLHFTIGVGEAAGGGARPFSSQALTVAAATPGVSGAQPVETSSVQYNGQAYAAWGLGPHPLYSYRLSAGRWFTAADAAAGTPAGGARPGRRGCLRRACRAGPHPRHGRRAGQGPRHRDRHRPEQQRQHRLLPTVDPGAAGRHARRRQLPVGEHRQLSARRHRPGGHRRREPAGRRRLPGHHHQDLRPRGSVHRRRELHPRHRRDPGPRRGRHHAHGPGQHPVHGDHRANQGDRHPPLPRRPLPPHPADLHHRGGRADPRRLGGSGSCSAG